MVDGDPSNLEPVAPDASGAPAPAPAAPPSKSTEWFVAIILMIVIGLTLAWFVRFVKS